MSNILITQDQCRLYYVDPKKPTVPIPPDDCYNGHFRDVRVTEKVFERLSNCIVGVTSFATKTDEVLKHFLFSRWLSSNSEHERFYIQSNIPAILFGATFEPTQGQFVRDTV